MSFVTTPDGAEIYFKDWGSGPVVTFSHGWPLNADAWDGQMLFLAQRGYRCVALDRRGHGRSSQPSARNDRHGTERMRKAILVAAVPPLMLRTPANPEGLPMAMFDAIRAGVAGDRSQYYQDLAIAFYGANRAGARVSQGILDQLRTIRSCRSRVRPGSGPG